MAGDDFYHVETLLRRYAAFNPPATFFYTDPTGHERIFPCTSSTWAKWLPSKPTSPHWYTVEHLRGLLAAYLVEDRATGRIRTVREFIAEFAGLKGTMKQKAVTAAAGLSGMTIENLVEGGDIANAAVRALLEAMQEASRPIKAQELGVLGQAHLTTYLEQHAAIARESVRYMKREGVADGLPYVLETACGWRLDTAPEDGRDLLVGLNWSPTLKAPWQELLMWLGEARVDTFDPVVVVVHLACPRLEYTDRGKTALALPDAVSSALRTALTTVTKTWKTLKRQHDREDRVLQRSLDHWSRMQRGQQRSVKDAAYEVMVEAYNKASGNGTYPANARQMSKQGVTILCLRDFDKTGFSIVHTLRTTTRRWQYRTPPRVFDLGLRLGDVESMGLQREQVQYDSKVDPRCNLLECGATPEECNFLVKWQTHGGWIGDRVELNAMDSMQFIAWLETKLRAVGVCKVVPDPLTLDTAYRRMIRLSRVQQAIETAVAHMPTDDEIAVPADLMGRIYNAIDGTAQSWDTALWQLVRAHT